MATKNMSTNTEENLYVYIPELQEEGGGVTTDQTIDIIINGQRHTILRGRREAVTYPEYEVLMESARCGRFSVQVI